MALTCFACAFCGSRGGTVRLAALLPDAGAAVVQADHFPSERLLVFGVRRGRHVLGSVAWGGGTGSGEEGGGKKKKINKVGTQQTGTPQLSLLVLRHPEYNTSLPVLTGGVFGRQLRRVLLPLLLQPSPPLQLLLLGGFGHGLQLMLPQ